MGFIGNYESQLQALARARGRVGVICGHIHTPADKRFGDVHYLNSGDRVESLTALVEHHDGRFEVLTHAEFRRRLQAAIEARRPPRPDLVPVPAWSARLRSSPPPARTGWGVHNRRENP